MFSIKDSGQLCHTFYFNKDFQLHEIYPNTFGKHSATSYSLTFATEAKCDSGALFTKIL